MKYLRFNLLTLTFLILFNVVNAGDLQKLFQEINANVIQQTTQGSNYVAMDSSGKIIPNTTGIKPPTTSNPTHNILEIGIERTTCYGSCPAYTFIVKSDGSFKYVGEQYVEHIGTFTGSMPRYAVNNVFLAIADLDYMNLSFQYTSSMLDAAAVYSKVVTTNEVKVIENYANTGPGKLLAVELLIDSLVSQINWDEVVDEASY